MRAGENLHTLEWPILLKQYSAHCASAPAKLLALQVIPENTLTLAQEKLNETREAFELLKDFRVGFVSALEEMDKPLDRCKKSAVLDGKELIFFAKLIEISTELQSEIAAQSKTLSIPRLVAFSNQLTDHKKLAEKIRAAIDPLGTVKDSASPLLRSLREQERKLHIEAKEKLEQVLQQAFREGRLQDKYYDFRDGRYLIPVKSEHKSKVPGLVVESSATKATVFMEPAAVRACNDEIKQTQLFIEEEVYRILSEISASLFPHALSLEQNYKIVLQLDLIFARALFAHELSNIRGASLPTFSNYFSLEGIYHPLLGFVLPPEKVIRNYFQLGPQKKILIISGPNTGGKTILLKAVGIASLMAQSGFYIASAGESILPFFDDVLAQIGDSQSLELSLSSFSGSILQLKSILESRSRAPLILIDEILHATDPDEATALSRSILEALEERGGFAIVTTHLNGLKVGGNPSFESASMEFDLDSLSPTYRLRIGVPGSSRALEIAGKLGLDPQLLSRAKNYLDSSKISHQESLDQLEIQEKNLRDTQEKALASEQKLELERIRFSDLNEALLKEKGNFRKEAAEKFKEQQKLALNELDLIISEYRKKLHSIEEKHRAAVESKEQTEKIRSLYQEAISEIASTLPEAPPKPQDSLEILSPPSPLKINGKVKITSINQEGVLLSDPIHRGKNAEVQVGNVRMRIPWDQLEGRSQPKSTTQGKTYIDQEIGVASEINLIGKNVDEARDLVMNYLDRAFRSGKPWVRLVHGHGSGALKRMVREILEKSPYETKFRPGMSNEGGDGCTIVEFV
jgi:DNA mismatch repair protein MutS2